MAKIITEIPTLHANNVTTHDNKNTKPTPNPVPTRL